MCTAVKRAVGRASRSRTDDRVCGGAFVVARKQYRAFHGVGDCACSGTYAHALTTGESACAEHHEIRLDLLDNGEQFMGRRALGVATNHARARCCQQVGGLGVRLLGVDSSVIDGDDRYLDVADPRHFGKRCGCCGGMR